MTLSAKFKVMHGRVPSKRGRGKPRKIRLANIKEWTGLKLVPAVRTADKRWDWRGMVGSLKVQVWSLYIMERDDDDDDDGYDVFALLHTAICY